ncbi:MAG: fibrillarin-like rRNA/tRNA 2'-O-methyltransferase [Candidatus Aenigmarchaeota archaeon]|nr:fibrillarin-like rRNA/tRNA 2'-O-methyltransferase [Candidatus Aenigmarchaeota archaeon]
MKEVFPGVFKVGKKLYTVNMAPGKKVYGEKLVRQQGKEFREWTPERSKLAAAISNNLRHFPFVKDAKILYLGASTGTTVSHVSDICTEGIVYAIEFSERVFHSLLELAKTRKNIVPLMADARKFERYQWVEEVDVIFVDVAQPDETYIAMRNAAEFLKKGGILMISIKSQSIDVTKKSRHVYEQEKQKLEKDYEILELIDLEPFEKNHALLTAKN